MADREKEGKTEIQKFDYLENEKSFLDKIKSNFHSFRLAKNTNLIKKADASFNFWSSHCRSP